jgi:hypothetical protein
VRQLHLTTRISGVSLSSGALMYAGSTAVVSRSELDVPEVQSETY